MSNISINNKRPILVHSPGQDHLNPCWKEIKQLCFNMPPRNKQNHNIEIITFNNSLKNEKSIYGKELGLFEESAKRCNLKVNVTGKGLNPWIGLHKVTLAYQIAINTNEKYILACDSSDVVFCGKIDLMIDKFKEKQCKLLFNAEKYFFPKTFPMSQESLRFQNQTHNGSYLNSGMWIGETEFVIEFLKACLGTKDIDNDQPMYHYWYPKFYPNVKIDLSSDIFLVLNRFKKQDLKLNKFI